MGTANCPEIRTEFALSPSERAEARDTFVRSFEQQFADWSSIAKVCVEIERDKDYLLLGFQSFGSWLMEAAPRSRSYIYLVMGRYKELAPDISDDNLARIPLESTLTLRKLSSKVRQSPELASAAIKKPKELRKYIQVNHPDQHIDDIVERRLKFTGEQWDRVETAYETYLLAHPGASLESFIDWMVVEFQ